MTGIKCNHANVFTSRTGIDAISRNVTITFRTGKRLFNRESLDRIAVLISIVDRQIIDIVNAIR